VGIFEEHVQPYTAKALTPCELYWISKPDFLISLDGYPEIRKYFEDAATCKVDDIIAFRSVGNAAIFVRGAHVMAKLSVSGRARSRALGPFGGGGVGIRLAQQQMQQQTQAQQLNDEIESDDWLLAPRKGFLSFIKAFRFQQATATVVPAPEDANMSFKNEGPEGIATSTSTSPKGSYI
jgi:hypothetical protein